MRTAAALLLSSGICLLLPACGGDGSPAEEVTKSVRNWTAALSEGDGKSACERMTTAGRFELARFAEAFAQTAPAADCATNVRRFTRKLSPQVQRQTLDADVDEVKIDGSVATVRMDRGGPTELRLLREDDGEWRVDQAFRHGWRLIGAPSNGQGVR